MATELTVTLPDESVERVQRIAEIVGQDVNDILAMMIELSFPRFIPKMDLGKPVSSLMDEDVLAATSLQMLSEYDERLSELLQEQKRNQLSNSDEAELQILMRVYEIGLTYKSQALAEAVKRGLIESLEP